MKRFVLGVLISTLPAVASGQAATEPTETALEACCAEGCSDVIGYYTKVSTALAHDDLKAAQEGSADLVCLASCSGDEAFIEQMAQFQAADSIEAARTVFKAISASVIPLAASAGSHFVMSCPMAGADWIQTTADVANPYFGASMFSCGAVKEEVTVAE